MGLESVEVICYYFYTIMFATYNCWSMYWYIVRRCLMRRRNSTFIRGGSGAKK